MLRFQVSSSLVSSWLFNNLNLLQEQKFHQRSPMKSGHPVQLLCFSLSVLLALSLLDTSSLPMHSLCSRTGFFSDVPASSLAVSDLFHSFLPTPTPHQASLEKNIFVYFRERECGGEVQGGGAEGESPKQTPH